MWTRPFKRTFRGELKRLLKEVRNRDIQILVGTQMLAKGHDFDGLTLVGVVTADQALFSADFRAIERMAQMLTQVSGRAGRGEVAGEVIVQTHEPEHPQLQNWLEQGYQLLLSCESRARLQNLLSKLVPQIDSIEGARRVRWSVDVDPIDLF